MLEVAGIVISGITLAKDLYLLYEKSQSWAEQDLEVDREWLGLAIKSGIVPGGKHDFRWSSSRQVATRELKNTHQTVLAYNEDKKICYRIVRGRGRDQLVLMKALPA